MTRQSWLAWEALELSLKTKKLHIIDGATGTQIERKGAAMNHHGWSCAAQLFAPEVVEEIHGDYINAGADIIIANTYATNRNVMARAGLGERTEEAITLAIDLARRAQNTYGKLDEARFKRPWVMASLSTHPPSIKAGTDGSDDEGYPLGDAEEQAYIDAANTIAKTQPGCDMLWLEMMKDTVHAAKAIRAAAQSGLPFFMRISTRISSEGQLYFYGKGGSLEHAEIFDEKSFKLLVETAGDNLKGINIMHTNFTAMGPTLEAVRSFGWNGILGAYPDHGHFKMPHWEFEEVDMEEAMKLVHGWVNRYDVRLVGGCCGLGPDFIEALKAMSEKL